MHPEIITCTCRSAVACRVPHGVWLAERARIEQQEAQHAHSEFARTLNAVPYTGDPAYPAESGTAAGVLRGHRPLPAEGVPDPAIPAGRYAIMIGPKPFFYRVTGSTTPGRLSLAEQITDNYVPPRHPRAQIFAAILVNVEQAGRDYARWLGRCRECGRQLTDHMNPYFERGYGPDCGAALFT